jgi:hypothetical protein
LILWHNGSRRLSRPMKQTESAVESIRLLSWCSKSVISIKYALCVHIEFPSNQPTALPTLVGDMPQHRRFVCVHRISMPSARAIDEWCSIYCIFTIYIRYIFLFCAIYQLGVAEADGNERINKRGKGNHS